ncbi:hypothetical protein [Paenibacillus medicaginis]|uniref:Uncharacterized protein n=1 Tax=Paenibacillus medicaginis TaxID=1470560 RepID=A0ABV5C8K4_9BACL
MQKLSKVLFLFTLSLTLFLSYNLSKASAAAVGQQLNSPESGWTRYSANSSFLKYISGWYHDTDEKAKIAYSGAKTGGTGELEYNFKGTGLRILTAVNYSYSKKVAVSIDGNVEYFSPHNASVRDYNYNILVYEKNDLEMGVHQVKMWTVEPSTNTLGNDYRLYSIDVIGELTHEEPNTEDPGTGEPTGPEDPTIPEEPSDPEPNGDRAILVITMVNGLEKEYDLSLSEVNSFIDWYDAKDAGSGSSKFAIDKHNNNIGPFKSRIDYVIFNNILTFEVNAYN